MSTAKLSKRFIPPPLDLEVQAAVHLARGARKPPCDGNRAQGPSAAPCPSRDRCREQRLACPTFVGYLEDPKRAGRRKPNPELATRELFDQAFGSDDMQEGKREN